MERKGKEKKKKKGKTYILNIPNPFPGVNILPQYLLDLLAGLGENHDCAPGKAERGRVRGGGGLVQDRAAHFVCARGDLRTEVGKVLTFIYISVISLCMQGGV